MLYRFSALLLALAALLTTACSNVKAAGHVAADARVYAFDAKYPGQARGDTVSLVVEPEVQAKTEDEVHTATLRPFYRLDPSDEKRSHADLREGSYKIAAGSFQGGIGAGQFTWGTLESYKPTDVMNQTDFVEAIDGTAKLGQPYASAGFVGEKAALRFYYLPYFRDRTFQGLRGRPRFAVPIDTDHPVFASDLGRWQPSGAARFTLSLGDFDFGAGLFTGLSREPRFVAELTTGQIAPRYDHIHQGSLDAQWTIGALVLKAEGYVRLWGESLRAFVAGGAGGEYTFFKLIGEADLSIGAEVLLDSRPVDAAPTFFQHDAFLGFRLAVNDTSNTEILLGAIVDAFDFQTFGRIGASRRFGEHWRVFLDVNTFVGRPGKLESSFLHDDHLRARIAYFF